jgi:uncharacterized delta-60 repeat protein
MPRRATLIICTLLLVALFATAASAAPGSLDPSFGEGGTVTSPPAAAVSDLVVQPNGKVVGVADPTGAATLVRFEVDGDLDLSFGVGGIASQSFGDRGFRGSALARQLDGKLVIAGLISRLDRRGRIGVVRFNVDGTIDKTFSTNGLVVTGLGRDDAVAHSVEALPDGDLLVGANTGIGWVVLRYDAQGSLVPSFGEGGVASSLGNGNLSSSESMALQADGGIVLGGRATGGGFTDFALLRFDLEGDLDTSFGEGGQVQTNVGNSWEDIRDLVIQPDGKIVAGGSSNRSYAFTLVRYLPGGSLDPSFGGGDGIVQRAMGGPPSFGVEALVQQPDGKLVAAGTSDSLGTPDFGLVRFLDDGRLDR